MARLVISAAVAAVAFVASGYDPAVALQAFTVTYGLTGFLDPNKRVLGPKLSDLKAPQASYGSPIPYVEGAPRLAGVVFWASAKREIATTTSQSKGGPGVDSTTFTYEIDILIGLACNQCDAIRRVWSNGLLIWSNADDADANTIVASSLTNAWRDIRFYSGAESQLPDPTYEAAVGIGNAPAYRQRATVFIEGLNLGGSGQLPVLTFEVLSEASNDWTATNFATLPLLETWPFLSGISAMNPGGFQIMYGTGYDSFNGGHTGFNVYDVSSAGAVTLASSFTYGAKEGNALQGSSDETCMVVEEWDGFFIPQIDHYRVYYADGSSVTLPLGVAASTESFTFAKRGNRMVLASNNVGGSKTVRIYNAVNGALIVQSAAMAYPMQFCAIGDGVVYGLDSQAGAQEGHNIYEIDLISGALLQTIATPIVAVQSAIACDADGKLFLFASGTVGNEYPVYEWSGAAWTKILNEPLLYSTPGERHAYYANNGVLATQRYDSSGLAPYREQFYIAVTRTGIVLPTLAAVVRRLCVRTGQLTLADLEVSALESQYVRAMAVSQVVATRQPLETLMAAYFFEFVEGWQLKAVLRGGAPAATVPYDDLAAGQDGAAEPLPLRRVNDIELPAFITVRYANVLNDFQDGAERSDRLVTESSAEAVVEVPLGLTPTEARRVADGNAMDIAVSILQIGPVALTREYSKLEPTDVIILTAANGSTFRARVVKATIGGGVASFELVLDDATAINSSISTDSDYTASTLIRLLASTDLELLDIPLLRDADDGPGIYAAVGATSGRWPGAEVDRSLDDVTFAKVIDVGERAVIGTASTTLGNFTGGNVFDEGNTLTVDVGDSSLSSTTRALLLTSDVNALLVGAEIVQFRTASNLSPGVYLLSGFHRGLRGTEWAMPGHVASERVVLLQTTDLRRIVDSAADLDVPYYWKAVTFGKTRASVASEVFTDTGVSLMPFAPVDLRVDRSDDGFRIHWHRRSRLASRFLAVVDPPLGEASASYDVEIRDAGAVLIESGTVSVPEYSASGLAAGGVLDAPLWGVRTISTQFVGVREDLPNSFTQARYVARCAADGSFLDQTASIGQRIFQIDNIGDAIYVATDRYSNTFPTYILSSQVYKFTRTSLGTVDATNTAGTLGDYAGLVCDGTNVWVSERTSGNLRKLNATTLVSVAAYAVSGTPTALFYTAGKIWIACEASNEIARFDIATLAEDLRFSVVSRPFDVLVDGGLIFVWGESAIGAYNTTTGASVQTHTFASISGLPQRGMCVFGGDVVAAGLVTSSSLVKLLFLDGTTGARNNLLASPYTGQTWFAAGSDGADLLLTGAPPGTSLETRRYSISAPDLAGYTATVWQNSATVGRGYPASLEL